MEISLTTRWEMGHRLMNHTGKCKNLHGHNYRAEIVLCFSRNNKLEDHGMIQIGNVIFDFGTIKEFIKNTILEKWDHCLALNEKDNSELISVIQKMGLKLQLTPKDPTAEVLSSIMVEELKKKLTEFGCCPEVIKIKLYENEDSSVVSFALGV